LASQTADEKRLFRIRRSGHLKDQVVMLDIWEPLKRIKIPRYFFITVDDLPPRIAADIK
jgi:hypothetical protein